MVGQNYKFNLSLCHFYDFMIIIPKNNLWSFKQERPNYGRSNKLPIKIIIFDYECPLNIMV